MVPELPLGAPKPELPFGVPKPEESAAAPAIAGANVSPKNKRVNAMESFFMPLFSSGGGRSCSITVVNF